MKLAEKTNLFFEAFAWQRVAEGLEGHYRNKGEPISTEVRELRIQADKLQRMITKPVNVVPALEEVVGANSVKKIGKIWGAHDRRIGAQHRKLLSVLERLIRKHVADTATKAQLRAAMKRMRSSVLELASNYQQQVLKA
jgi:hypothetical protein